MNTLKFIAFGELCKRYGAEDLPVECPLSTLSSMVAAVTSIDEEDRGGFKATLEQLDLSQNLDPLPVAGGNFDDYCFILGQNEQCASTDSDVWIPKAAETQTLDLLMERAPQSMLLVSDSKSPEKQVTSAGEDIVKRKGSTNDLADHVLDAVSFHLLLFPDAQKPDTELRFRISNTRTIAGAGGNKFTVYVLQLTQGVLHWVVEKRYSDFVALNDALLAQAKDATDSDSLPLQDWPALTGKKRIMGLFKKEDVESQRVKKLTLYLDSMLDISFRRRKRPNYILLSFLGALTSKLENSTGKGSLKTVGTVTADREAPSDAVGVKGKSIPKRGHGRKKSASSDNKDQGRMSFHINSLTSFVKPGDIILFRCKSMAAGLQRAATGKEFDHTAIVVNTPMQRYTRGRSTRRPEDDKPDQRIYAASRTSNFGGVGSTIVSSVDASGRLETSVAAKSPTIDYESVARQLNRLDLCLLEATAAGVTVLPITERLRAYDHYNCCDYICLRRLRKTTCKDDGTDSETSHDYHGTLDAKTLYRLNCFVVAAEQRPYKFVLRNILFAGKAKQQHHNQSDSTEGSIPSLLQHVDAEGWGVFKGVPDTNVAVQGNSSRSQGKKASRGATQEGDTEDAMDEGSDDGMPLDKKSFFCSALTAAALQVLHILPASLNEDYFWPGSFAWGAEMDAILRDIQYGKMNERRVASGNAVEWYSYDREAFIDCRVPEIEAAVEITPGAAIWADSTKGKSMTESLGLEQASADRSDTHLQSVPSRWLHMEEHAMTESRRRAAAANPGETFAPSIF